MSSEQTKTMAESNREPVRCPCGFFGRPETAGLCSKCFNEYQQKKVADAAPEKQTAPTPQVTNDTFTKAIADVITPTSSGEKASAGPETPSSDNATDTDMGPKNPADSSASHESCSLIASEKFLSLDPGSSNAGTKRSRAESESDSQSDIAADNKKKRDEAGEGEEAAADLDPNRPVQKKKKRCFKCNCKLQPAIREIGRCKCDYVFCQLHRLPEQHDCIYDHKEKGRQEARKKMVRPNKHVGTTLKRLDSNDY